MPKFNKMLSNIVRLYHQQRLRGAAIWLLLVAVAFSTPSYGQSLTVHEFKLANGLKILVKEDHRSPVVVSQVWYKVGSSYEYGGITGISHMLEHMMFKGTDKYAPGEFSRIIAQESGKPLTYARAEVARSVSTFEIASQEALRLDGEMLTLDITESAHGKAGLTRRFPIGPIAGISPFNYPLNLVAHKVAPALACGNPIIIKPASSTPLTALLLEKIVQNTQAIEGSLSVLPCTSKNAAPLVEDPRLKMVTFTGSPDVGWGIKKRAGRKKVVLELGGNAGVIVEPDAEIDLAAKKNSLWSLCLFWTSLYLSSTRLCPRLKA